MPESKSSKKENNEKNTTCHCGSNCHCNTRSRIAKNAFPACFLACVLTAALVALCFMIAIISTTYYSGDNRFAKQYSGQFNEEVKESYDFTRTTISAGAVVDFFHSNKTGFIYASTSDCVKCKDFEKNLADAAKEKDVYNRIYHYNYPFEPSDIDRYAHAQTIADDEGPVLLYVRNGRIYDRLDETESDLAIATFLAKYK